MRIRLWTVVRHGVLALAAIIGSMGISSCGEDAPPETVGKSPSSPMGTEDDNARERAAADAFNHWAPLLTSGATEDARALCESWLAESDRGHHGEAHKCLANVAIATSRAAISGMPPAAEDAARAPISSDGVDSALAHYKAAIAINPLDIDAHVGRVDVLIVGARYRDANAALEKSLVRFSSRELLDNWFKLLGRFQRAGADEEGLAYLKVIEKHHPLDERVITNLAAYFAITGHQHEAFDYSARAMAINPDDPINKWNLAKLHDQRDELEDADLLYQEALATIDGSDMRARCEYAGFVALRMNDPARACAFAETECPELYDANCVPSEPDERRHEEQP